MFEICIRSTFPQFFEKIEFLDFYPAGIEEGGGVA